MLIFIVSIGYEVIILKYCEKINDFSMINCLKEKSGFEYKKYRLTEESEMNINNDNNELRRCLI